MLQATDGPDPNDPRSRGLPKVPDFVTASRPRYGNAGRPKVRYPTRLCVVPGYESTPERSEVLAAFGRLGVGVVDVTLPEEWDPLTGGAFNNVRLPERSEPFDELAFDRRVLDRVRRSLSDAPPLAFDVRPEQRRIGAQAVAEGAELFRLA